MYEYNLQTWPSSKNPIIQLYVHETPLICNKISTGNAYCSFAPIETKHTLNRITSEQVHGLSLSPSVLSPLFSCRDIVLLLVFIHFRICGFQKRLKIHVLCDAYHRTEGRGITQLAFCHFQ